MKTFTKLKQVEESGKFSCVTQGYLASHKFGVNFHVIFQLDVCSGPTGLGTKRKQMPFSPRLLMKKIVVSISFLQGWRTRKIQLCYPGIPIFSYFWGKLPCDFSVIDFCSAGADPGFFFRRGAPLRNGVTDW